MSQNFRVVCSEVPDLDVNQMEEPPVLQQFLLVKYQVMTLLNKTHCIAQIFSYISKTHVCLLVFFVRKLCIFKSKDKLFFLTYFFYIFHETYNINMKKKISFSYTDVLF